MKMDAWAPKAPEPFGRCEIVQFARPARRGAIPAGSVGKVIDVYGTPPQFYAVEVPEARTWAIVQPDAIVEPPYKGRGERALRGRTAVDLGLLVATGLRLPDHFVSMALGPFPQTVLQEEVLSALVRPSSLITHYRIGHGFEAQFGEAIEMLVGLPGLDGRLVEMTAGFVLAVPSPGKPEKLTQLYAYPTHGGTEGPKSG